MTDKKIHSDIFYNQNNSKDVEDVLIKQELSSYIKTSYGIKKLTVERTFYNQFNESYKSEPIVIK